MKYTLKNIKGLYVGDICYALEDKIYDGVWGKNGYEDGMYETEDGLQFAVAGTAHGDGTYYSGDGHDYSVDAGVIGVVDLRLATKYSLEELDSLGHVFPNADEVQFIAEDGYFDITVFENGKRIITYDIETGYEEEWDDEDEWDEEF